MGEPKTKFLVVGNSVVRGDLDPIVVDDGSIRLLTSFRDKMKGADGVEHQNISSR